MSISTNPPPAPQKKRMGCCGCGCLVLGLLVLLVVGLVAGASYFGYTKLVALTATTPAAVPSGDGTDELYGSARQKLADFDHDVKDHQAATIELSADEINVLIARNPDVIKNKIQAFVTFTNDQGRVQASFPTDALSHGMMTGRYVNVDASFTVQFDPQGKSLNLTIRALQLGSKVLIGPDIDNEAFMRSFTPAFNQSFNNGIRQNPDGAALLDQAKNIEIKDGQLVIETQ